MPARLLQPRREEGRPDGRPFFHCIRALLSGVYPAPELSDNGRMDESLSTYVITAALRARIREIAERTESLRLYILFLLVAGIAMILAAVTGYGFYKNPHSHPMQAAVILVGLVPSFLLYGLLNRLYRRKAKSYLMAKISETLLFAYNENGVFAPAEIARHTILPASASAQVEDGFSGAYRDIALELEEVRLGGLRQLPGADDPRREMREFWGLLIRLRLKRPLAAHTVVLPAASRQAFFAKSFEGYKEIVLSSETFARNYVALSTDSVEAKFTLTPAFLDRFMEAGKFMAARWGAASFCGDEILFALQRFRPLFEVTPLWRPVTQETLHRSVEELETVLRLIDTLKANSQLGI
jgi:hypothetical protein